MLTGSAPMATNPTNMVKTTARWLSFRMLPAGALAMAAIALASFAVRASTGSHSKSGNSGCVSGCQNQWSADGGQCVNRDPACIIAARAKYDACVIACSKPKNTTTTTRPRPTTTTTTLVKTSTTTTTRPTTTTSRPTTTTTTTTSTTATTAPKHTTTTSTAPAHPKTTTTTTVNSSTTTTTLVLAFSPGTAACLKQAAADKKICLGSASASECQLEYDTAFTNCFAPGKGVTCAAGCAAKRNKCTSTSAAGASTRATCTSDCHKQWINAGGQCGGANQACLAVARAAYDACVAACANPAAVSCRTAFAACVAKCPNL